MINIFLLQKKYGDTHKEVIEKIEIYFENELKRKLGEKPYKFVNNPNTPAGWQRPYCPFYIDEKGKTSLCFHS